MKSLCPFCKRLEDDRDEAWRDLANEKRRRMELETRLHEQRHEIEGMFAQIVALKRTIMELKVKR